MAGRPTHPPRPGSRVWPRVWSRAIFLRLRAGTLVPRALDGARRTRGPLPPTEREKSGAWKLCPLPQPAADSTDPSSRIPTEIARQPGTVYYQSVAQIGVQVAEALEYAHRQGDLAP